MGGNAGVTGIVSALTRQDADYDARWVEVPQGFKGLPR